MNHQQIQKLYKLVEKKQNLLKMERFQFTGEPIAPNTLKSNVKLAVIEQVETKPHHQQLIEISNESYANLNSSKECMAKIQAQNIKIHGGEMSIYFLQSKESIMIHNLSSCVVVVARSQQIRIHDCKNCVFLIESVENDQIVIEECHLICINEGVKVDDFSFPTKQLENPNFTYFNDPSIIQRLKQSANIRDKEKVQAEVESVLSELK